MSDSVAGAAVVLAAGRSSRMGRTKALLPFAGGTFLAAVVGSIRAAGIDRLWVVLGPDSSAARGEVPVEVPPERILFNPEPDRGPIGSLRLALAALPADVPWLLMALVDHPAVRAETVRGLAERADSAPRDAIVVPMNRGRRGHPVVFGAGVFDELRSGPEAEGARGVVRRRPDRVIEWACDDVGILKDVDTPADLEGLS